MYKTLEEPLMVDVHKKRKILTTASGYAEVVG